MAQTESGAEAKTETETVDSSQTGTRRVLLFDGVCNLCTSSVEFVIKRDSGAKFKFASLESEAGKRLLEEFDLADTDDFDSIILIEGDDYYTKSTAALKVARQLGLPWSLLYVFVIVPKFVRDGVYDFIANRRYNWFGKKDECMVPSSDVKDRFLD
ncbi:MAG: thiol-disulfide oxidoreductase DCC family protein [Halobacteria archaeon]|nr:thiol-disulfide oxidoreductase DCC family protein [Halobacteria archaeon]